MPAATTDLSRDLRAFLDAGPSPQHAVAEIARRLEAAGAQRHSERDHWQLEAGQLGYVIRDGSSIVAFRIGSVPLPEKGARILGSHTDSPTFKVRPRHDVRQAGYTLVGVEPYGGLLAHSWLDRDLTVAGRLALRDGSTRLVKLPGAPVRLPSLAPHLDRSISEALTLDRQRDLVPMWATDLQAEPGLLEALASTTDLSPHDIAGHDLVLADTQPASDTGPDGTWIASPRLDDLGGCHSNLTAFLQAPQAEATAVLVCNDHEEVGSGSAEGARGSFLEDTLRRLAAATGHPDPQDYARMIASSRLVSNDMAHAVHPSRYDRHEPSHRPQLGGGPVLKINANQAYATDAVSGAWFATTCTERGIPLQHFVSRADLPCGSTIGPLTAIRTGIQTVDVGAPMLAMHSCRELASALDVPLMVAALTACLG